jgi:hypothetical protein
MPRSIDELFEDADDGQLIEAIVGAIEDRWLEGAVLPPEQEVPFIVWGATGLISNGGFPRLWSTWSETAEDTLAAYEAIGAHEAVARFRESLAVFPNGIPPDDPQEIFRYLEGLPPEKRAQFDAKCGPLHHEAIIPVLSDWIRARREKYAGLVRRSATLVTSRDPLPPPSPDAPRSEVAAWLTSIGGPKFPMTLRGITLPDARRDTDQSLRVLAAWVGRDEIEYVGLEDCRVSPSGLEALLDLRCLRSLDASSPHIGDAHLKVIARLPHLADLNLSGARITNAGLAGLATMPALRSLKLVGFSAAGSTLKEFGGLEDLEIGSSPGIDGTLAFLESMPGLASLSVYGARLEAVAVRRVATRSGLRSLTLWNTGLVESDLSPLAGHPALRTLSLSELRITEVGAEILASVPNLEAVNFGDAEYTKGALGVFAQRKPALKVDPQRFG